jgi:hypothetical protein
MRPFNGKNPMVFRQFRDQDALDEFSGSSKDLSDYSLYLAPDDAIIITYVDHPLDLQIDWQLDGYETLHERVDQIQYGFGQLLWDTNNHPGNKLFAFSDGFYLLTSAVSEYEDHPQYTSGCAIVFKMVDEVPVLQALFDFS